MFFFCFISPNIENLAKSLTKIVALNIPSIIIAISTEIDNVHTIKEKIKTLNFKQNGKEKLSNSQYSIMLKNKVFELPLLLNN